MNAKNNGRILVVDDNEVALGALEELLRREGFRFSRHDVELMRYMRQKPMSACR